MEVSTIYQIREINLPDTFVTKALGELDLRENVQWKWGEPIEKLRAYELDSEHSEQVV